MNPVPSEGLWTVKEVAKFLQASSSWVYKAAERNELPCIHIGTLVRFEPAGIRAWLATKRTGPALTGGSNVP
jgi:excisionase family DNA binding protein